MIEPSAIDEVLSEGIRAVLRKKHRQVLEDAKKQLEEEFERTVRDGADRVQTWIRDSVKDFGIERQIDLVVQILDAKGNKL